MTNAHDTKANDTIDDADLGCDHTGGLCRRDFGLDCDQRLVIQAPCDGETTMVAPSGRVIRVRS
jgi:hypothetical protein